MRFGLVELVIYSEDGDLCRKNTRLPGVFVVCGLHQSLTCCATTAFSAANLSTASRAVKK